MIAPDWAVTMARCNAWRNAAHLAAAGTRTDATELFVMPEAA